MSRPLSSTRLSLRCGAVIALAVALFSTEPVAAGRPGTLPIRFAISAGAQTWSLETLETVSNERAWEAAGAGFGLKGIEYGWVPAFGADFRIDFPKPWFFRLHAEWLRLKAEDRAGTVLLEMGRGSRFVSVGYETEVGTRPFIGSIDFGRQFWLGGTPVWLCVGPVLAPVKVTDTYTDWIEGETSIGELKRESTGFGVGVVGTLTLGYFAGTTDLFLEFFYRNGSTQVELDEPGFERPLLPRKREIEFTGAGVRLGIGF